MHFGKNKLYAGAMITAALATAAALAAAQQSTPQQTTGAQASTGATQSVPDAPRPQTVQQFTGITPIAPAVAVPPPPSDASSPGDNNGQAAPTGSLADAPQAQNPPDNDGAPPPDGAAAFTLNRVQVNFVEVPFTVKDNKGNPVPGLTWRDVRVYENGARQPLRVFTTDPFPLSVAIVIDQSVTEDTMVKINDSLRALQGAFTPYDEVSVFTYASHVTKQTGFTAAQSARLGAVLEKSKAVGRDPIMGLGGPIAHGAVINNQNVPSPENMGPTPATTLYAPKEFHVLNDAIFAAAQETATAGRGRRRVVFVISDGKEAGSKIKEKELIRYLQTNKVAVYATIVGETAIDGVGFLDRIHLPGQMRDDILPRYAAATGGQCDPAFRLRTIEDSFAKITEQVRTQYTVGYYSHEPLLDDRFRHIEVRVLRPGLTVIAKEGYYPSAQDAARSTPASAPTATP